MCAIAHRPASTWLHVLLGQPLKPILSSDQLLLDLVCSCGHLKPSPAASELVRSHPRAFCFKDPTCTTPNSLCSFVPRKIGPRRASPIQEATFCPRPSHRIAPHPPSVGPCSIPPVLSPGTETLLLHLDTPNDSPFVTDRWSWLFPHYSGLGSRLVTTTTTHNKGMKVLKPCRITG